jgi:hypothetical protein
MISSVWNIAVMKLRTLSLSVQPLLALVESLSDIVLEVMVLLGTYAMGSEGRGIVPEDCARAVEE